jgi:uncharacterized protein related to proFAR isomerase
MQKIEINLPISLEDRIEIHNYSVIHAIDKDMIKRYGESTDVVENIRWKISQLASLRIALLPSVQFDEEHNKYVIETDTVHKVEIYKAKNKWYIRGV